ncbi:MAG: LacI family transcriptional regulator [Clostridium sp.]|nr:LacI family transcriptional regulator [Clostridium sp.]
MNIYDIAKLAGVSIATVSRVVNDSPKVSGKTKAAVLKVMEENNYTPNVFARGLGLGSMKSVGIVCPDVADAYMARAVSYLEKNLRGYGYDCILYCSGYDDEDKRQAVELIFKKQIDALILVGSNYAGIDGKTPDYVQEAAAQIPVFLINGYLTDDNIYCVLADDFQAVYDITEELLFSGKKKILFLFNSHSYSAQRKRRGYEEALAAHGIQADENLILYCENSISATRDMLLCRRGLSFDSVIATEDGLAVGAMKYAAATGRRIPEELSITGYNNSELSITCTPELSSVDNRVEILCKTAIDSLMALLSGQKAPQRQMIKCHLIKRCTTDF